MVASKLHCYYCFDVLAAHLQGADPKAVAPPPVPRSTAPDAGADVDSDESDATPPSYPLFITWSTSPTLALRGCIGNFSPLPLAHGLRDYALISATQDHRFAPIRARELPALHVSVSLLVDFEPCADPFDWAVGTHGIRIAFTCPRTNKPLGATFLPEVASDHGWDHARTLGQLVKKAGWAGGWMAVSERVKVVRYQSRKARCSYQEYVAWVDAGRVVDGSVVGDGQGGEEEEEEVSSSA